MRDKMLHHHFFQGYQELFMLKEEGKLLNTNPLILECSMSRIQEGVVYCSHF